MAKIFVSYSHADEALKVQLEKHLSGLTRRGVIEVWNDRCIPEGSKFAPEIDANLDSADLILLLVSHNFLASDYCYQIEMARALERHEAGEAIVIPVILEPCLWKSEAFAQIKVLPKDGKPIVQFPTLNEGLLDVAEGVERAAARVSNSSPMKLPQSTEGLRSGPASQHSSNLHIPVEVTDREKDQFLMDTFSEIAGVFQQSIAELPTRNPKAGVEGRFERLDAANFHAVLYLNGNVASECWISRDGGSYSRGTITYSRERRSQGGQSFNEALTVEVKDEILFLKPLMSMMTSNPVDRARDELSPRGAAELLWARFMEPAQRPKW